VAKARQEIADDTPIGGKQRSPAHVRAIMAYLAMRKERALLKSGLDAANQYARKVISELELLTEQQANARAVATRYKKEMERASDAEHKLLNQRRRAVLKARDLQNRLHAEYKIVDRANDKRMEAERELASLKQKLADPTNPARESDLLMLRDNAQKWQGKAEAAIAEGERLKQQVVHYGGQIENLAVRLARAEAMLRADPLQLTRIAA
jgi:DNA repair exonuclease SbcCD ATPase subunit